LECEEGPILADDARLLASGGPNVLRVFDGQLSGKMIQFGQGKKENAYVEQWSSTDDSLVWNVRVTEPTSFAVTATYDAKPESVGGLYAISCGGQKLTAFVKAGTEQSQVVGRLRLEAGYHQIRAEALQIAGTELMNLRSLALTRVVHETASR